MSDTRAYTYPIGPNGSGFDEDERVHQSSPSWILTFVSWKYRDTLRIKFAQGANQGNSDLDKLKSVNNPLVVRNDCISVTTTSNKAAHTPNMEATLVQTDTNYLTAIAPGDFVIVNMLNWEKDAEDVAIRAEKLQPINGLKDGFKGLFKVQSVRRVVGISPEGIKTVRFKITGFAFTEFNNIIYFDPSVVQQQFEGDLVFSKRLAETWHQQINENKGVPVQKIIRILAETFIGKGVSSQPGNSLGTHDSQNTSFYMPSAIGSLLGISNVTAAKDIYNFIFGIQKYNNTNANSAHSGLNPSGLSNINGRTWESANCPGVSLLKGEYWNQVTTWDILNQYVNRPINEMFTCFRVAPNKDSVVPTVVLRQTPFTSEDFILNGQGVVGNQNITRFLTLPRWHIDPAMVLMEDMGRDEALRINYVQVFGRVLQATNQGTDFTMESSMGNYVYEKNDIQRSGLKPTVVTSQFDLFGENSGSSYNSISWAKILGDAMIGAHLRLNGTLVCLGIVDPIPAGDNLEYDGTVYHIEQVSHTSSIDSGSGIKVFRTTISLSQGVSVASNSKKDGGTIYAQMRNPNAYAERAKDYKNNGILPGVSESQDIPSRPDLDKNDPMKSPNSGFPQPKEITVSQAKPKKKKGK